ncbi:MAG: MarR family transcriptional regulator [SAR324 cluster bacterium]|nr:MarR family transcriptional regulator [SAR324 cluster bacterium]
MTSINPNDCLYYLISRATLVTTSALKKDFEIAGIPEMKPAYLGVLLSLWKEDGLQSAELGRKAGLEPSTMTGLLDRMERDALILRQADPNDRRAQRIYLTQNGRNLQESVMAIVNQTLNRMNAGISVEEINVVKKTLKTLLSNSLGGQ